MAVRGHTQLARQAPRLGKSDLGREARAKCESVLSATDGAFSPRLMLFQFLKGHRKKKKEKPPPQATYFTCK